jgi:hypothetical protein
MADLGLSDEALETYEGLERDQSRWPTLDKVEEVLQAIADAPGDRDARLRRFQDPPCFAVPVATPEGEWVVLWRPVAEHDGFSNLAVGDVYVLYLGALPG